MLRFDPPYDVISLYDIDGKAYDYILTPKTSIGSIKSKVLQPRYICTGSTVEIEYEIEGR
ncbi:MAG: hypothetical protein OHK0039_11890 [Bacteroidia bacterium]